MRRLAIVAGLLAAGCTPTLCVFGGTGIGPYGSANWMAREITCRGHTSGCCAGTLACRCATTCSCWMNPDHAAAQGLAR